MNELPKKVPVTVYIGECVTAGFAKQEDEGFFLEVLDSNAKVIGRYEITAEKFGFICDLYMHLEPIDVHLYL